MRKLFYLLVILLSLSLTSCQYILALMFVQPTTPDERAPVSRVDNVVSGDTGVIIIIHENDKIFCYEGGNINNGRQYSYQDNSITRFLLNEKRKFGDDLQIQIKTTKDCSDANTDSILKVMTKNQIVKYALEDASNFETDFVHKLSDD